jgi:hypothetical protein
MIAALSRAVNTADIRAPGATRPMNPARPAGLDSRRLRPRKEHSVTTHDIGTREDWRKAYKDLRAQEKDLTRRADELARQRRALPWVPVTKEYRFQTNAGEKSLAELSTVGPS